MGCRTKTCGIHKPITRNEAVYAAKAALRGVAGMVAWLAGVTLGDALEAQSHAGIGSPSSGPWNK